MATKWQQYRRVKKDVEEFFQNALRYDGDEPELVTGRECHEHDMCCSQRKPEDSENGSDTPAEVRTVRDRFPVQRNFGCDVLDVSGAAHAPEDSPEDSLQDSLEAEDLERDMWSDDIDSPTGSATGAYSCRPGASSPTVNAAEGLAQIALKHKLTHSATNDMCLYLRSLGHSVPRDARTLLRTERKASVENDAAYFGLQAQILKRLEHGLRDQSNCKVDLHINIDGLPIFKSSSVSFWVLLCSVANAVDNRPFVVAVHCGKKKPSDIELFLRPFLDEMKAMEASGLSFKGEHHDVTLSAVICDAPARSYVKCTKGHMGYHGCDRCTQKGERVERRQTFPICVSFESRTDSSFRAMADPGHHHTASPLLELRVDMVMQFPVDYMHAVCLGVVRKLLQTWISGPLPQRLGALQRRLLSARLEQCKLPLEFARQPRTLDEVERWKAVEFRSLLLYTGPVLLGDLLEAEQYQHFLCLHVAMRILLHPVLCTEMNTYASHLLKYFAQQSPKLYGEHFLVYNVHMMCHIADDCLTFGSLDNVSAFTFENHLGQVKGLLRTNSKPLEQVSRRLSEMAHSTRSPPRKVFPTDVSSLKAGAEKDSCCLLTNDRIFSVQEVTAEFLVGYELPRGRSFFSIPMPSEKLKIFCTDGASRQMKKWPVKYFHSKCVKLPWKSGFVVFPLVHHG